MAIEVIDQADPPPSTSQLPVECSVLAHNLHAEQLAHNTHEGVRAYRRAADYIAAGEYDERRHVPQLIWSAAMIFLKDNVLMDRDLRASDIKPRLLGNVKRPIPMVQDQAHSVMNRPLGHMSRSQPHSRPCQSAHTEVRP